MRTIVQTHYDPTTGQAGAAAVREHRKVLTNARRRFNRALKRGDATNAKRALSVYHARVAGAIYWADTDDAYRQLRERATDLDAQYAATFNYPGVTW